MEVKELEKLIGKGGPKAPVQAGGGATGGGGALDELVDQTVTLRGVAHEAALGAVVVLDGGGVVYFDGRADWPGPVSGKTIDVTGVLRRRKLAPDPVVGANSGISHGVAGESWVFEDATWTAVTA